MAISALPMFCQLLLPHFTEEYCNPNPSNRLFHAARTRDVEKTIFLLGCTNLNVNHIDQYSGETALLVSCKRENLDIIGLLLEQYEIDPNIGSTESGTTPLHIAALKGNTDVAKLLLTKENLEMNIGRFIDGATPLILAAESWQTDIVVLLLQYSAVNINQARRDGKTALIIAAEIGNSEIVDELLESKDINVNKEPHNGGCALYQASKFGHIEVLKRLIYHHNIDINQAHQRTELSSIHIAFERGHLDVVKVLLHCPKTDITKRDRKHVTIHDKAKNSRALEIINLLKMHESDDAYEHSCCTQQVNKKIINATRSGDIEKVTMLSRCSEFDVNKGHDGYTPLQVAAREGHSNLVKFFLGNNHIEVNKVDEKEVSALFYACNNSHVAAVKELLAFPGIDLNVHHAKDGSSALHVVTKHQNSKILKLLVNHSNINVNSVEDEGRTVLMISASMGQLDLMQIILVHPKIDVNSLTYYDRTTALYAAVSNKQNEAVKLLLSQPQANVNKGMSSPLGASVGKRYTSIVKSIMRCPKTHIQNAKWHGILVTDYANQNTFTEISYLLQNQDLLLVAARTCCLKPDQDLLRSAYLDHIVMMQETLKCPGADIDYQGEPKNALYIASELGHFEYVKVIASYSEIDLNRRNTYYKNTALFIAAEKNKIKVVKVLLNHPDIGINQGRLSDGKTAFSIASERGHFEVMKILILHDDTNVNLGWLQSSWTFQTKMDVKIESKPPLVSTTNMKGRSLFVIHGNNFNSFFFVLTSVLPFPPFLLS